ncbi:hypothetical protein [Streptomyces formicae]|uniref:Zinc-finger domain-containing protein n=1 Tax=Streptomyces formicae TaxID=1616117 RepID=A0ABY3WIC7_9ACTN|nr:hypothetical protein [Streptomyces formicae]UNM12346.1 hypothetical protein J4032_13075 [Streptomyces formicae]
MDQAEELLMEFKRHADTCPGCATSLEVGTWLVHRCPRGKRMAWQLVDLMMKAKSTD